MLCKLRGRCEKQRPQSYNVCKKGRWGIDNPCKRTACKELASVTVGSGLKTIGANAFMNCHALTQIVLPDGFETLGDGAFSKCTGLTDVFLPKSLLGISPMSYDTSPFAGCTGSLNLYSDAPEYNQTWDRYFGRITYGVSYEEYLSIVGDR